MQVEIIRRTPGEIGTQGTLTILDPKRPWSCDTLELPWKNNAPRESCIMADVYKARLWLSPTFKTMVVRLEDKHNRTNCLIHPGNFAGDLSQGLGSDVEGCTLVGQSFGMLMHPKLKARQWGILSSVITLNELVSRLGPGEHSIAYKWAKGCEPEDPTNHYYKKE